MRQNKNTWFYIGGSGLHRTDDFQKIFKFRTGSDSILSDQDWTWTENFHSLLICGSYHIVVCTSKPPRNNQRRWLTNASPQDRLAAALASQSYSSPDPCSYLVNNRGDRSHFFDSCSGTLWKFTVRFVFALWKLELNAYFGSWIKITFGVILQLPNVDKWSHGFSAGKEFVASYLHCMISEYQVELQP